MQTDFFIQQDTNTSFLMNCAGETEISGHVSGSLKGLNSSKQQQMAFLSTLIGIAHDHDFSQTGESLILPDLVLGGDISENTRLINVAKLYGNGTPELKVDVAPMDSEEAGKENSNSNESISVSSFIEGQDKDSQDMRYPVRVPEQTMQKAV